MCEHKTEPPHCCHGHQSVAPSVHQTLDEMDFQRGVWSAALDGEVDRVQSYLRDGGDPNVVDSSSYTALHYAARNGHLEICQLLLQHRATVDPCTRSGRVTPLHRAAYCGHLAVVTLLLQHRASVTACDTDGKCALHHAAGRGHKQVMKLLLQKDPSCSQITDNHNRTAKDCVPIGPGDNELYRLLDKT